jgi:hypothetical protein
LLSKVTTEIEYQADRLGNALARLESCIVIAPGNDELWLTEGFLEEARPLVERVYARSKVTIWNGVNWYQEMEKRKSGDDVEDRFHFNDSLLNKMLVAKTIVEIATLNNFVHNLEVAIGEAGGDSGSQAHPDEERRTEVLKQPLNQKE